MAKKKQQQQTARQAVQQHLDKRDMLRRHVIRLCNELPNQLATEQESKGRLYAHRKLIRALGLDDVQVTRRYCMIGDLNASYAFQSALDELQQAEQHAERLLRQYDFR
jgi:hypothetical protein